MPVPAWSDSVGPSRPDKTNGRQIISHREAGRDTNLRVLDADGLSAAELASARQAKRNCVRVTERWEEEGSVKREPRYTKRIGRGAGRGEQASDCEVLAAKGEAT